MENYESLCDVMFETLSDFGVKGSIGFYRRTSRELGVYLESSGKDFSAEAGQEWLESVWLDEDGNKGAHQLNMRRRRLVLLMEDCQKGSPASWRRYNRNSAARPALPVFAGLVDIHQRALEERGKAESSISIHAHVASDFLIYLEGTGATGVGDITAMSVAGYFAQEGFSRRKPRGVQNYAYRLRQFLKYLEDEGILPEKGTYLAVPCAFITDQGIVKTLPDAAIERLLSAESLNSGHGIRDKAMILMALKLGMRRCDICAIRFCDIDWAHERITFVQKKTGVPHELPLLPEVGNALMDYILTARPESDSQEVFLGHNPPHKPLKQVYPRIVKKHLGDIGGELPGGLHVLRRTFASTMLRAKVPRSVISASLGQLDPTSADAYLATDEERMRECALGLEGIGCRKEELR